MILYQAFFNIAGMLKDEPRNKWFTSLKIARHAAKVALREHYAKDGDYVEIQQVLITALPKKRLTVRLLNRKRFVADRQSLESWTIRNKKLERTLHQPPSESDNNASDNTASTTR